MGIIKDVFGGKVQEVKWKTEGGDKRSPMGRKKQEVEGAVIMRKKDFSENNRKHGVNTIIGKYEV